MPRSALVAAALLLSVAAAACTDPEAVPTPTSTATPDSRGGSTQTLLTEDGLHLDARLFLGDRQRIVILLHQYSADQTSWFEQAKALQAEGYSALTFDFRGYGESEGDADPAEIVTDVDAALTFAGAQGYSEAILVGASMGGTAAMVAADEDPSTRTPVTSGEAPEVAGVVAISAPVEFAGLDASTAAADLEAPMAVIAALGDESARTSYDEFVEIADIPVQNRLLVGGTAHGTELLRSPYAHSVWERVLRFIGAIWPA